MVDSLLHHLESRVSAGGTPCPWGRGCAGHGGWFAPTEGCRPGEDLVTRARESVQTGPRRDGPMKHNSETTHDTHTPGLTPSAPHCQLDLSDEGRIPSHSRALWTFVPRSSLVGSGPGTGGTVMETFGSSEDSSRLGPCRSRSPPLGTHTRQGTTGTTPPRSPPSGTQETPGPTDEGWRSRRGTEEQKEGSRRPTLTT